MKRSRLKHEANKSQLPTNSSKYKKQRNLVVKLNKKHKKKYLQNLNLVTNLKPFWDKCKEIADVLNSCFDSVTDLLDLFAWSTQTDSDNINTVQNILNILRRFPYHTITRV